MDGHGVDPFDRFDRRIIVAKNTDPMLSLHVKFGRMLLHFMRQMRNIHMNRLTDAPTWYRDKKTGRKGNTNKDLFFKDTVHVVAAEDLICVLV